MRTGGIETRDKIVEAAKKRFYEYGYKKTKIQSIAEDSGIALGSLAFYFKKKEDLLSYMFYEYLNKFYNFIHATRKAEGNDFFKLHAAASIPYYTNILNDEKTRQFYLELLRNGTPYMQQTAASIFYKQTYVLRFSILSENKRTDNDFQKDAIYQYETAGRTAVIQKLMEGAYDDFPAPYVINNVTVWFGRVMGLEEKLIKEAIEFADAFCDQYDMSDIRLLK